jgi:hypothetical protein
LFFWIAVTGWVAGFWLFAGRYEQTAWCVWVLFPVAVWNGRRVLDLWRGLSLETRGWWVLFWALIGWQFLITGLRGGNWWAGAGAGRDVLLVFSLVSGLVMIGRDEQGRNLLWKVVFAVGSVAVVVSLISFFSEIRIHEERFRLCWRWWPGFNAVTTGILAGMALMVGLATGENGPRWWKSCACAALAVLGFGLAASESRGPLLAVVAGAVWWLPGNVRSWHRLSWALGGFATYWVLAGFADSGSGGFLGRGSSGRFDIYRSYLSQMAGADWWVGRGRVWMLSESVLGWRVHHPHNAYLGQIAGYGLAGLLLMLATLGWGFLKIRRSPESAILVFGLVTLLFDGGRVFSMFSTARWEVLVVMVPLVLGMAVGGASGSRAKCNRVIRIK